MWNSCLDLNHCKLGQDQLPERKRQIFSWGSLKPVLLPVSMYHIIHIFAKSYKIQQVRNHIKKDSICTQFLRCCFRIWYVAIRNISFEIFLIKIFEEGEVLTWKLRSCQKISKAFSLLILQTLGASCVDNGSKLVTLVIWQSSNACKSSRRTKAIIFATERQPSI